METVKDLFTTMKRFANHKAIKTRDNSLTYEELINRSQMLANGLKEIVKPGDKIAVWLPNSIEWVVVQLAAGLVGAVVVPLNLRYKTHEITFILQHSESKMLIFKPELEDYNYLNLVEQTIKENSFPHLDYIISTDDVNIESNISDLRMLSSFYQESNAGLEIFDKESSDPERIYNILYTSGTTSDPKGVMLPQRMVIKHSLNAARYLQMDSNDVVLGCLPFCGIFGFNTLFSSLISGATLIPVERYRYLDAMQQIEHHQCTVFNAVDGMILPILDEQHHKKFDLSSVRIGAVAIFSSNNRVFIERVLEKFPRMTVVQTYGMTEVSALVFVGNPNTSLEERALVGGPKVSQEIVIEILDKDTGIPLEAGKEGEIAIGGYNVMAGYYENPEKTRESFTPDGLFKTGDLGVKLENGTFIYKSRLRDALRLKGFLVSPKEIEDYICLMPEIEVVQIVHVDFESENRLVAFIKLKEECTLSEHQVFEFCREGLADFKCPQSIIFVDDFPKTAGSNGEKIQRGQLIELAKDKFLTAR